MTPKMPKPQAKKIPFRELPIYAAIRGCKLSKRAQNEVLRKLKKYYKQKRLLNEGAIRLQACFWWQSTDEGYEYWLQMHNDSSL